MIALSNKTIRFVKQFDLCYDLGMKKHWAVGNKNAAKDDTLDARLAFRCSKEEREYVLGKAKEQGSVTAVMRNLINKEKEAKPQ